MCRLEISGGNHLRMLRESSGEDGWSTVEYWVMLLGLPECHENQCCRSQGSSGRRIRLGSSEICPVCEESVGAKPLLSTFHSRLGSLQRF